MNARDDFMLGGVVLVPQARSLVCFRLQLCRVPIFKEPRLVPMSCITRPQTNTPFRSVPGRSSFANPMATRTSPTLVSVSPLPLFKVDVDPLDGIAPSTVAMIILFGSLTFATVGMAAKAWMTGDKRGEFVQM